MTDSRQAIVDWLHNEFAEEHRTDYARLKRIPDTYVVRFLDIFCNLTTHEQSNVVDILTERSSYMLMRQQTPPPVVERFTHLVRVPGFAEGLRYTGVNLLAGLAKTATYGSLEGWLKSTGITGIATRPSKHLASGIEELIPVKIPTLKRMVQRALAKRFDVDVKDIGSEMYFYQGKLGDSLLKVLIRYSGRMGRPQLAYEIQVQNTKIGLTLQNLCFELVLGVGFGRWDYITQANAERSTELLGDLVEYIAKLPERLPII